MTADRPGHDGETRCTAAFTTPWGDRRCDLRAGHDGLHVRNDGCGRPEYVWTTATPPARWDAAVTARPAGHDEAAPPVCTTIDCENPGTLTGVFHDGDDDDGYRVIYCSECAEAVGDMFTPDEPDDGFVTAGQYRIPKEPLHFPSSPVTDQAREDIAQILLDWAKTLANNDEPPTPYAIADAVLATATLRQLRDVEAAVQRVRAVLAKAERDAERSPARMFDGRPFPPSIWHEDLRRALDGTASPANRPEQVTT